MSYYRLNEENGLITVVEDFDYSHQDRSNFLLDPEDPGYLLYFSTESEAVEYLNRKIKEEHIHPKWKRPDTNQARFFK